MEVVALAVLAGSDIGLSLGALGGGDVLLAAFAALMLLVGTLMAWRLVRRQGHGPLHPASAGLEQEKGSGFLSRLFSRQET